jgi:capsular exopolysaccharide synthesis family protein
MADKKQKKIQASTKLTDSTPFHIAEAYKTLRTNLLFSLAASKNKAIVISSASPNEGKSSNCANLAITMAQTGAKVIVIDADLRKPTQHFIFKKANRQGLTDILAGFSEVNELIDMDVEPGLDLIVSGPIPPNPSELLGTDHMNELLEILSANYDYIFIDTPPINIVTDAMVIAGKTAGVLLVARQLQSTYDDLTKAITSIEFSGASILGIIINAMSEKRGEFGKHKYGKYKYYSYGSK